MDIGTAKPSAEERAQVPHHLIDVAEPDEIWSLAMFQKAAQDAIGGIHSRNRLPLLVGGTGQYLRAILEGWAPPRLAAQPELRSVLEVWVEQIGKDGLHARLARLDAEAASRIDARNVRRTIRALEVILTTGQKFSHARRKVESPYHVMQIGIMLPRADLYKRIDDRIDEMLHAGWLNEVNRLLDKGYSAELPSMSAIGYSQLVAHLEGEMSLEEAISLIKHDTRIFVRRQANWFKKSDPQIKWFNADDDNVVEKVEKAIQKIPLTE
jgi:tRNA dimethylallyltransferase